MKELLGGKGANLAEMASLGLPVPPGFTITTEVCTAYYANGRKLPDGLEQEVEAALAHVGKAVGATFGDAGAPLLVSVRSGARASMPGMMDTILNLGLNDATVEGPGRQVGQRALRLRQLPPLHPDVCRRGAGRRPRRVRGHPREPQEPQRPHARHRARRRRLAARSSTPTRRRSSARPASRSRRTPPSSCGAPSPPCSAPGRTRAPTPIAACTASPTAGARRSTCRPWCSATWATPRPPASPSRATPRPARARSTASSWSTRRARTSSPASARRSR